MGSLLIHYQVNTILIYLFNKIVHRDIKKEFKGGSTAFTLTSAMYQRDGEDSVALSVFIQDEKRYELLWIRNVFHDFLKAMVEDLGFREKAIHKLGNMN